MRVVEDTRYEINDPNRYNIIHDSKPIIKDEEETMIRATKKATVTKDDLLDVFWKKGLVGVYNLGLKNMFDYLNGK
jgi:hypothetical protein